MTAPTLPAMSEADVMAIFDAIDPWKSEWRMRVAEAFIAARDAQWAARLDELREALQFVERWAVHHGTKPHMTPAEALSCIQHYPAIKSITASYADGKAPDTPNPFAQRDTLAGEVDRLQHMLSNADNEWQARLDAAVRGETEQCARVCRAIADAVRVRKDIEHLSVSLVASATAQDCEGTIRARTKT